MPEPEEEPHAYGVCQSCGGSLRFPVRGEGTTIGCPHCGNATVLKPNTAPPILLPLQPYPVRRMPKPWSWKDHKGAVIGWSIAIVCGSFILVLAFLEDAEFQKTIILKFAGISLFLLIGVIYFMPSIVARERKHAQVLAITVLNIFAGWTLVGWIVALVWACTTPAPHSKD